MSLNGAASPERSRVTALDGIRGIAILGVLLLHYEARQESPITALRFLWAPLVGSGWAGVDLFFVLSGFLITGILLDTRKHPHFFRLFYARRTLRIFPLYYLALILIFLLAPPLQLAEPVPVATQLWYWSYLSNLKMAWVGWGFAPAHTPHFWSLAIEEQFYLVWPAVVYFASALTVRRICVVVMISSLLSRLLLVLGNAPDSMVELLTSSRVEPLAVGALVASVLRHAPTAAIWRRLTRPVTIAALTMLLFAVFMARSAQPKGIWMGTVGISAIAWLGAMAIVHGTDGSRPSSRRSILENSLLTFFGRYSYGIYVWHYPVMIVLASQQVTVAHLAEWTGSTNLANLLFVGTNLSVTLLFTLMSWQLVERPLLQLKSRFSYGRVASPEAAVNSAVP